MQMIGFGPMDTHGENSLSLVQVFEIVYSRSLLLLPSSPSSPLCVISSCHVLIPSLLHSLLHSLLASLFFFCPCQEKVCNAKLEGGRKSFRKEKNRNELRVSRRNETKQNYKKGVLGKRSN
jgi:hypothetical protein